MATVGTLTVDLIAQTASFNANIEKASANLTSHANKMNASLGTLQKSVALTQRLVERMAEAFVLREVFEAGKHALEYAASLKVQAQQIGLTTEQLQVYRYAAGQVNVDQDALDLGVRKLTASLGKAAVGAEGPTRALAAMGISVRDSNGHLKTTGTLLPEISDKLAKVRSPLQRAAEEVTLFGRSGQQLDPLLTQGSKGIDDFKKRAEELGLVLSDQLGEKAHEAEVRMRELNLQLKVNFASVVAQNAAAILGLASALEAVTIKAINFINNYPRLAGALAGAAAGAVAAGPGGAIVGAGAGFIGGNQLAVNSDDANLDPAVRLKKLNAARGKLADVQKNGGTVYSLGPLGNIHQTDATLKGATKELEKQTSLTRQSVALWKQARAASAPTAGDLPDFLGGRGAKKRRGKSAEQLAEEAARKEKAFQDQLASLNGDYLNAKRDTLTSADDIATNAKQQLMAERARLIIDAEEKVKTKDLTRAQADIIEQKVAQVAAEKLLTIDTDAAAQKAQEALNLRLAANDNQRDLLQAQSSLAVTTKDRLDFALKLLDLDRQEEVARNQQIIAMAALGKASQEEADAAKARLAALPGIYAARTADARQQNEGPLSAYLREIPKGKDAIGERIEQLEVDELESVRDGIDNAISKVLGTKDPLIVGLIDLFIRENLIRPIADALRKAHSSGGGGGGLAGIFASLFHAGASAATGGSSGIVTDTTSFAGMFAEGTTGSRGGWAIVGERGPELLPLRPGQPVIPNHRIGQFLAPGLVANDRGGDTYHLHLSVPGSMSEREARRTGSQIASAMQQRIALTRKSGLAG